MAELQNNLARLQDYLAPYRDGMVTNLIDGKAVPAQSGATFQTTSPVDDSVIATVARSGAEDVDAAAKAAKARSGSGKGAYEPR